MRANEFLVEGPLARSLGNMGRGLGSMAANAGKSVASGLGNAVSGITQSVKDTDSDWLKGQLYRYGGGKYGQSGNVAATKNIFIKNFKQEYDQITNSARKSGMDVPSVKEYITDYIEQAGWRADPAQIAKLVTASGNNITNIANGVYAIAMMNQRSSKTQGSPQDTNKPSTDNDALSFGGKNLDPNDPADARLIQLYQTQHGQQTPNETPGGLPLDQAPTTDKILQTIEKMTGSSYADDLETIADHALRNLFDTNKGAYTSALRAIQSGKRQSDSPQQGQRIEPTMNESTRKTTFFVSRHK